MTNQCHDITVFPEVGLAAGACSGNGILLDISDPVNPSASTHVVDKNFAYWHSATFNNDGTKVIFTDEWGGGTRPRCRATDPPTWGADADLRHRRQEAEFGGYYKMPAPQTEQENCVAHNGSLIPVPGPRHHGAGVVSGRRVGVRLHRFGQPGRDRVLRSRSDRREEPDHRRLLVDLLVQRLHLRLRDGVVRREEFNAQQQPKVTWPASAVVARAYVDQLKRAKAISPSARAAWCRRWSARSRCDERSQSAATPPPLPAGLPLEATLAVPLAPTRSA